MVSVFDVANYFLSLVEEEVGECLTNLKLQKLVYYAQGFHLAMFDRPLFKEPIEAWTHGPVVPELYHHYKEYGSTFIPCPKINLDLFDQETQSLLGEVYQMYGQYSAWRLRDLTHMEPPWRDVFDRATPGELITHSALKRYFVTQLVD